jgi:hypothetical protein
MKKRESLCFKKLVLLGTALALVVSFVAIAAYTTGEKIAEMTAFPRGEYVKGSAVGATKFVLWDNGMDYNNLLTAQIESDPSGIISEPADDFQFDADQVVSDVHWIGGYYNGPPVDGDFDWQITFYNDFGDGTKPGTVINTWVFPNADVNETWIEDIYMGACYSYSVYLPTPLSFSAGTKYWISIQGIGDTYPQSGWAYHDPPLLLHQAVIRSEYYGYPDWTDLSVALGYPVNMCFQLTGEPFPNHKMHFPQLPDEIGWDVMATNPDTLADDWQCSGTGPVTEIHFWGSWKDQDGIPETDDVGQIQYFQFGIWSNLPVGHPQNPFPYSIPGSLLWSREEWVPGTPSDPPTLEAWYDPWVPEVVPNDHVPYWQYDFVDIPDPFVQQQDSIYWLSISAVLDDPQNFQWGWKNSRDHFEDDAVFMSPTGEWVEMYEPPRQNYFSAFFQEGGLEVYDQGSTNYYGTGWYYYEDTGWWNIWFYNNPFTYDQTKEIICDFWVWDLGMNFWAYFAINWSTDLWSLEGVPGRPPLPGEDESIYIGRQEYGELQQGHHGFNLTLPYNPEWVSIDFIVSNGEVEGWISHECVGTSLDLAFVITGEPSPYICGDANGDGAVGPADVVYLINYLFRPGSPPPDPLAAGDVNCDGVVNAADIVYLLNWLFRNGYDPCDTDGDGIPDC